MFSSRLELPDVVRTATLKDLFHRICVRPPYFALREVELEGRFLHAVASAESPPFLERGPMPAAELGRHAAIVGLCHAAASQEDDRRRYYLARHAECRYVPNRQAYGTPVRLTSEVAALTKRTARAAVRVAAGGEPLAAFDVDYTILTEAAFERLFRARAKHTPAALSPYGELLERAYRRDGDAVEQIVDRIPVDACVGHFGGFPALPVAVLMGQLSYLAGQLYGDGDEPFRVVRGSVDATDLAWAGERVRFSVRRDGAADGAERFACAAFAGERQVGGMTLWLVPADGAASGVS